LISKKVRHLMLRIVGNQPRNTRNQRKKNVGGKVRSKVLNQRRLCFSNGQNTYPFFINFIYTQLPNQSNHLHTERMGKKVSIHHALNPENQHGDSSTILAATAPKKQGRPDVSVKDGIFARFQC